MSRGSAGDVGRGMRRVLWDIGRPTSAACRNVLARRNCGAFLMGRTNVTCRRRKNRLFQTLRRGITGLGRSRWIVRGPCGRDFPHGPRIPAFSQTGLLLNGSQGFGPVESPVRQPDEPRERLPGRRGPPQAESSAWGEDLSYHRWNRTTAIAG